MAQVTPQVGPLHTGLPSLGSTQAVQPVAEHPEATLLLATHTVLAPVPQAWKPASQLGTHAPPALHATDPLVGVGHAEQPFMVHPEATLVLATQRFPHR